MGAQEFMVTATGASAQEAFVNAKDEAYYQHGHGGYTGSIAEKNSFTVITTPEGVKPEQFADQLLYEGDPRIDDKWGPAGCIKIGEEQYLFFGIASS